MENRTDTELVECLRHQVKFSHGDAAAQDEDVVGLEVKLEPALELSQIVDNVIIGDALETVCSQSRDDSVCVGTPYLVRQKRLAGLDELVTRGDDCEHGLTAHPDSRHSCRCGNRDLGRA